MSVATAEPPVVDDPRNDLPDELIERLFARISEVSTLPDAAVQIISLASDPDSGADDLLEAVRGDPALAMRLMRTVNSSYYALNGKVADLKQAITLLGFKEVRNLALTSYVAQLFQNEGDHANYSRRGLWNHMVGTGMVAQLLAQTCGRVPSPEAYLAGLLHDVGFILLDQYLHAPFCRMIDALSEDVPVNRVEWRILGFDHGALGAHVTREWKLPDQVILSAEHHHRPSRYEGEHHDMICLVSLADFFCNLKNLTALGVRYSGNPPMELFFELGFEKEQVSSVLKQLDNVLTAAHLMAGVQVR